MSCWWQTRVQNRQKPQRFHDRMFLLRAMSVRARRQIRGILHPNLSPTELLFAGSEAQTQCRLQLLLVVEV